MAASENSIPYSASTVIALEPAHFEAIQRTVSQLFQFAHSPAYQKVLDADAEPLLRHVPGNFGVFMGYDFHITPQGPRLIEVNTNAGGALLNGLHTASLCDPVRLACLCSDLLPVATLEQKITATFQAEFAAVRGTAAKLARVAIVDDRPQEQFLYPEFELFRALFALAGIEARVADTRALTHAAEGGVEIDGWPVDLVYLRDTDFSLAGERTRVLRDAYLAGSVVVSPSPREHFLLADKRRMTIFSCEAALRSLGVSEETARWLATVIPETRSLADLGAEAAWRSRAEWVFKPAASFGSRAVYRGDKISRKRFEVILQEAGYVAQRRVDPGLVTVETSEGPRAMKFDVRAYAYQDRVLLLGARVYEGQVTNLRSPGGGFSAICVTRRDQETGSRCSPS